ncbi:COBRA-like protein 7 [Camellia lanceoleosa]|uniref:COBRA-like protein 7 n=1 Tax=Camellia lanceoleosa TaxID=1840588 RepID=A0ACC0FTA2_9ERIC|nr:COBRA-like protein 7 [Camellia lanceoleosa]
MANLSHSLTTLLFFAITISVLPISSLSQPNETCNGIFISYTYNSGYPLPPTLLPSDPTHQPYRFQSFLTVLNNALYELKSWRVFVGFQHREFLVSAPLAVLADGTSLPAGVGNGSVFSGSALPDLKSAAETAGDLNQMQVKIELVGTQFGIGAPDVPMPATLSLANDGFFCPAPTKNGNNELHLCCTQNSSYKSNFTVNKDFQSRQNGDLTIMYDVIKSFDTNYWAQVTISNHNPLVRLDNWQLSWDWTRDEFIGSMRGGYPYLVNTADCVFGPQGQYYKGMDFSTALNCERRPTIIDLPLTKTNDPNLGFVPFCCRNGTILPPDMDSSKSKSVFLMQVYKMPPDLNISQLTPPQNWKINGTVNSDYQCGPPVMVSRSLFPNPSGLPSESAAVASWQVVCNITQSNLGKPKCCVSFSAFFNDSVVPCNTCACGCNNRPINSVCSETTPSLLLPSEALLVPFENRTKEAADRAKLKKQALPNPLPCGDNCGISINWHLLTDYSGGWTARITLFNWGETDFVDWFAAVQLDKATPGFEAMYSFNGSVLPNATNTIFLQGLPGLNYLLAEKDGHNPKKDPRVPGMQQSVISFTKKTTPGINVARGDGFPTKVYFNGEECSLPSILPGSSHKIGAHTSFRSILLALLVLLFVQ